MSPIGLYYPHTDIANDSWLKYSALYWPRMARLRPRVCDRVSTGVEQWLYGQQWLFDIEPPAWAALEVAEPFFALIHEHTEVLASRFGLDSDLCARNLSGEINPRLLAVELDKGRPSWAQDLDALVAGHGLRLTQHAALTFIAVDNVSDDLVESLIRAKLAVTASFSGARWLGMDPRLAVVYMCALAERVATGDQLHPVTDLTMPYTASGAWTVDRLARVLLADPRICAERNGESPEVQDAFVYVAFETVMPSGIADVPIERILEVRRRYGVEFDAFRTYAGEQAQLLAGLQDVRDIAVFREHLHTEVHTRASAQLRDLEERLHSLGMQSARSVANVKTLALPPVAAGAADYLGIAAEITTPTVLAACVLTAPLQWRSQRRNAIRTSPVGYLFRIDRKLNAVSLASRIARRWPRH